MEEENNINNNNNNDIINDNINNNNNNNNIDNNTFVINSPLHHHSSESNKYKEFLKLFKRKNRHSLTEGFFNNPELNLILNKSTKGLTLPKYKHTLEPSSIVYQMPNTGESKNKDYEKISGDIRRLELSIRRESRKNLKRLSQKRLTMFKEKKENKDKDKDINESISSEGIFNIDDDEYNQTNNESYIEKYNILEVIQKFKIPPENRTVEDLYITKNFLLETKLIKYYIKEFNNDKRTIENLITFFGLEFRYQKFNKGETIYRIDDYADNFYMVLLGKVGIFNIKEKYASLTGYEYFSYIMKLKKNNEMHRYKLCIEENKKIYPIFIDDEDLLPYIFLQFVLDDIKEGKLIKDFAKILELINLKPKDIGLNENKLNSIDYILERERRILKKIVNFSKDKIKDYRFINNKIIKRAVKLFEYEKVKSIEPLEYFGDESIESGTPREETVICTENCELIYIINKLYINNIMPKKSLILEKKTAFLGKNYLFDKIAPKKFIKKYFDLFKLETYNKGDILFEEAQPLDYIYFIKEGNVNLLTSKSILEMEMFLNEINKKLNDVQSIFNNVENKEDEKNIVLYNNIKSSSIELLDHINKREKIQIFVLKKGEDTGLISYLLGMGHLVTGIVESPQTQIYKIKKSDFAEILKNERICFYELINRVEDKLKVLSQRFYEINNIKLSMTDQKIAEDNMIKYNTIINNKKGPEKNKDIFPTKNETKADVDKIKEIINDHDENIYLNNYKTISKMKNLSLTLPNLMNKLNSINIKSKKMKNIKLIKNMKNFFTKQKTDNTINKKKSFFPEDHNTKPKDYHILEKVKKILYYKKRFPYEDEFLSKLTENMDYLFENQLLLTKRIKKNNTFESNINIENNNNNDINKITNEEINKQNNKNNLLLTQIDSFDNKLKANHIFTKTEAKFNKKININNNNSLHNLKLAIQIINNSKDNFSTLNTYKENNIRKKNKERNSTLNNYSTSKKIHRMETLFQKNYKERNKRHPYISPLTMVKLNRYKMIEEKDPFKENKKIYEKNVIKSFKEKGLNQFGFPITYDKSIQRKFNYDKIKKK